MCGALIIQNSGKMPRERQSRVVLSDGHRRGTRSDRIYICRKITRIPAHVACSEINASIATPQDMLLHERRTRTKVQRTSECTLETLKKTLIAEISASRAEILILQHILKAVRVSSSPRRNNSPIFLLPSSRPSLVQKRPIIQGSHFISLSTRLPRMIL